MKETGRGQRSPLLWSWHPRKVPSPSLPQINLYCFLCSPTSCASPLPSQGGVGGGGWGQFRIAGSFFRDSTLLGAIRSGKWQDVFSKAPKCWEGPGETTDLPSSRKVASKSDYVADLLWLFHITRGRYIIHWILLFINILKPGQIWDSLRPPLAWSAFSCIEAPNSSQEKWESESPKDRPWI